MMCDLLRDQRREDLTAYLHQLMRREVVLEQPFVGPAFVRRSPSRHARLFTLPCRDDPENVTCDLSRCVKRGPNFQIGGTSDPPKMQVDLGVGNDSNSSRD